MPLGCGNILTPFGFETCSLSTRISFTMLTRSLSHAHTWLVMCKHTFFFNLQTLAIKPVFVLRIMLCEMNVIWGQGRLEMTWHTVLRKG